MRLTIFIFALSFAFSALGAERQVDLKWDYRNFDLKIEHYKVVGPKAREVSFTEVYKSKSDAPIGERWDGPIPVKVSQALALVIENPKDQDYYFFAVPHTVDPAPGSLGNLFECLCIGHVFKVPAKSTWVRVARLSFGKNSTPLKALSMTHQIYGLTLEEVKKTGKKIYGR